MTSILRRHNRSVVYLAITDYLAIACSFIVAVKLRLWTTVDVVNFSRAYVIPPGLLVLCITPLIQVLFAALDLYNQIWKSKLLKKSLDDQTALVDKLLKL